MKKIFKQALFCVAVMMGLVEAQYILGLLYED